MNHDQIDKIQQYFNVKSCSINCQFHRHLKKGMLNELSPDSGPLDYFRVTRDGKLFQVEKREIKKGLENENDLDE